MRGEKSTGKLVALIGHLRCNWRAEEEGFFQKGPQGEEVLQSE